MERIRRYLLACGSPLLVLSGLVLGGVAFAAPEPSTYITGVRIEMSSLRRFADESDNFHLTWHSDGALYGAYGDGWGFVRSDIPKRAIGVSRITGSPPRLAGREVWEGDAQGGSCCWAEWNGKSWGMLSTGEKLHKWFTQGRPRRLGFREARIATSLDDGRTWRKLDWAFTARDGMLMPSFLQLGQGYRAAGLPASVADHVYSYHSRLVVTPGEVQTPGRIDLIRAPRDRVSERGAYRFFAGLGPNGEPRWASELGQRRPVLEKAHVLDTPPAVTWNPHLGRFIMVMPHVPRTDRRRRGVAFYEARWPWGPWRRIELIDRFAQESVFFFQLPAKWQQPDRSAWLAFSGIDVRNGQEWDALNIVKVRFTVQGRS